MPISVACPKCARVYTSKTPLQAASFTCASCGAQVPCQPARPVAPAQPAVGPLNLPPPAPKPSPPTPPPAATNANAGQDKFCVSCGQQLVAAAYVCPKCGVKQPGMDKLGKSDPRHAIRMTVIVSLGGNFLAAMTWLITVFCAPMAIMPIILGFYEFQFVTKINTMTPIEYRTQARQLAVYQMLAGVLFLGVISFICGVLNYSLTGDDEG